MKHAELKVGLRHSERRIVDASLTVPALPAVFTGVQDMPPAFATAYLVALIEVTCIAALKPYLAEHQQSVGTHIDVSHLAATPIGFGVSATVELIEIEGRRLRFKVECRDDVEIIGAGYHERFIIDAPKFRARLEEKAGRREA